MNGYPIRAIGGRGRVLALPAAGAPFAAAILAACSSSPPSHRPSEAFDAAAETCASPGEATPGPADDHCAGGVVRTTSEASCFVDGGGAGDVGDAGDACVYGDTHFGNESDDDDCKYHVVWTSGPICENAEVPFTVTLTHLSDGSPATGIPSGIILELFVPATLDAACDVHAIAGGPLSISFGQSLTETTPGSGVYEGPIVFNGPGEWTLRFHIHEECTDALPDSPHGHAAFHIDVP